MNYRVKVERSLEVAIRNLKDAKEFEHARLIAAIESDQQVTSTLLARLAEMIGDLEAVLVAGSVNGASGTVRATRASSPASSVKAKPRKKRRRVGGQYTPTHDFRIPLLRALDVLGGAAQSQDVMKIIEETMPLKPADYKTIHGSRPVERWRNTIVWLRHDMTSEGLINLDPKRRGRWILTAAGRKVLRNHDVDRISVLTDSLRSINDVSAS